MKMQQVRIAPYIDIESLKEFVRAQISPQAMQSDKEARFNWDIYKELHARGVLTCIVPKEFGGQELPVSDLIWIARELAYGSAGCAATFIGNLLGLSSIVLYADKDLKAEICRDYMKNFSVWSFAMTEGGAGSDLMNIATEVIETENEFVLNGEKNFITNGTVSRQMCVFARHKHKDGSDYGISCFYVPPDAPGVERGAAMDKIGWRESNTGTILFKNVRLPKRNLLGKPGEGLGILTHCLNRSKTLLAAVSVGISYRALDLTQERLTATQRFGKSLMELHAIRHVWARLHTDVEAAWMLACKAAVAWDEGVSAVKESSMAKLFAGRVGGDVTRETMELFGARGYSNEFEISKLYRDAKAIEIVEGPSLVQELLISKHLLTPAKKKQDSYSFKNEAKAKKAA